MYFLSNILVICTLVHLSVPSLYVFLSRAISMEWTKQMSSVSHASWSHTPSDRFKTFSDIFYDENSHKLALLKDYHVKNESEAICNLTVRIHNFDGQIDTKTCDVIPPRRTNENREVISTEKILFLKNDRVLVSWKIVHETTGEHTLIKVISLDTCNSSKFVNLNVATNITHNIGRKFYKIIRLKDSFDVVFENFEICPRGYCKLSFNYDGDEIVSNSLSFLDQFLGENETLFINSINTMKTNSGIGVVLTGKKNQSPTDGLVFVQDVYSPNLGWTKATAVSSDYVFHSEYQDYSNENGFAALCWIQIFRNKLSCKWLDDAHKTENVLGNNLTTDIDHRVRMPRIYNTRDGQIIMMNHGSENENKFIFIDKLSPDGRCKRFMKIFSKNGSYPQYYLLTITDQNKFCFSFIMWRSHASRKNNFNFVESYAYTYEFITQCIEIPNYFTPDDIICGTGYL